MPPTPYYEDEHVTLYCGDCREVLPTLEPDSVDLVLTDPPYMGLAGGVTSKHTKIAAVHHTTTTVADPWNANLDWMPEAWRVARLGLLVFASHHSVAAVAQAIPAEHHVALVTWHRPNSAPSARNAPRFVSGFVWCFRKAPGLTWRNLHTVIEVPFPQAGCVATERVLMPGSGKAAHPTQKPLALMHRLLSVGAETILDPFAGTGTTLVAAAAEGRKAVGIELDENYCRIAVERLQAIQPHLNGLRAA